MSMNQPANPGNELPNDVLAEQAILSSILSVPESFDDLSNIVAPEDFFEPRNELIFAAVTILRERGDSINPLAVNSYLSTEGLSSQTGGLQYLSEILSPNHLTAFSSDPISYARIVKDYADRRRLIQTSQIIRQGATLGGDESKATAAEALEFAEQAVIELSQSSETTDVKSASALWDITMQNIKDAEEMPEGSVPGIRSPFPVLDEMTTGFHGSQVTLIGARPAVGKSAMALDFARGAAYLANKSVLFFSLEMTEQELMMRLLSAEARIPQQDLKKGRLTQEEWMSLESVKDRIKNGSLFFDVTAEVGISHLRSRAIRQMLSPAGLDLIIVDYLQLMKVPEGNRNTNREQQVSALSRSIKLLAKQLNVPIILLSQLNRNSESRVDKKPAMSDLRESGAIEQDMDVILLLHRPEQSDPNLRPGEADLIVAKNRHGPTGTVPLVPVLEFSKFMPGEGEYSQNTSYANLDENGQPGYVEPSDADDIPWE